MGEENKTQWNPIGRYGKRLKCMNCLSEKHLIKDCKEERRCYVCMKREHLGKDCRDNYFNQTEKKEKKEKNRRNRVFSAMKWIREGI